VLIKNAHIPSVGTRDIQIDEGTITKIEPSLDGEAGIDAKNLVAIPGFVDTHRHLVQTPLRGIGPDMTLQEYLADLLGRISTRLTPEDAKHSILLGAVEALDAGITTILDWSSAAIPAEITLEALHQAGIRAVFAHGNPGDDRDVRKHADQKGLVTTALAPGGPDYVSIEDTTRHINLARELGLLASIHIGGRQSGGIKMLHEANLLGPDLHFSHGNRTTDDELKMIADSGAGLTISTIVESMMGHGAPAYDRFQAQGGSPALGVDVVVNNRPDMFSEMQATLWHKRPAKAGELLKAATTNGAKAIGRNETGELKVGKRADIVLLDGLEHLLATKTDIEGAIVATLSTENVRTVLVDGEVVKRDGVLTRHDLKALREATRDIAARVTA
jgi:5-methylthioadenosine/S-adenosylhomocysteine deaminase